jgi:hypothetical protein
LDIETKVSFLFDPTTYDLETALSTDWREPHQVIAVYQRKVKDGVRSNSSSGIPPGYVLDVAPLTTGYLIDEVKEQALSTSIVDNKVIYELDIAKCNCESFPVLKELLEANKESGTPLDPSLIKLYRKHPTSLYKILKGALGYPTELEVLQEDYYYYSYLVALTDLDSIRKKWMFMPYAEAMKLFASTDNTFLSWLSRHHTSHSSLAVLLQPFVLAFKANLKVEYIHDFARWIFAARAFGVNRRELGVALMTDSLTQRRTVYCSFSSNSINTWAKLVQAVNLHK